MHKLFDLAVRMQISGTEDIHVVPFVDFIKEASKIDADAHTIRIGDNNFRLDNAELGLKDDPNMKPFTVEPVQTLEVEETEKTDSPVQDPMI